MFVEHEKRVATEPGREEQPLAPAKLSEIVRQEGWGETFSYHDCVLGRAYRRITGRSLADDGCSLPSSEKLDSHYFVRVAAVALDVPYSIAEGAEDMCFAHKSPNEIADWLEGQGY